MKQPRQILAVQAIYYLITALWALVHIRSFMVVTGPKTDIWLVKTVAVLLLVISLSFIVQLFNPASGPWPIMILAMSSCIVLAGIDIYYTSKNTIRSIYLADAVAELLLLAWWVMVIATNKQCLTGNMRTP